MQETDCTMRSDPQNAAQLAMVYRIIAARQIQTPFPIWATKILPIPLRWMRWRATSGIAKSTVKAPQPMSPANQRDIIVPASMGMEVQAHARNEKHNPNAAKAQEMAFMTKAGERSSESALEMFFAEPPNKAVSSL